MFAFLYLILTFIFGFSLAYSFIDEKHLYESLGSKEMAKAMPSFLFTIPIGWLIGMILMTTTNYYLIYLLHMIFKNLNNYYTWGIIINSLIFIALTIYNFKRARKGNNIFNYKNYKFYAIVIAIVTIVSSFLMFYTYQIRGDTLYVGVTTASDMSPHTAMTSSFGVGGNIPTNYMHFGNDGIRYHFLFYFFAGLLNYMGFPVDLAINIPSIITMVLTIILAGTLATLLSKRKISFLITPILIYFRSSLNFIIIIAEIIKKHGNVIKEIFGSLAWSNVTPYDEWGIWAINVYPNQRHLMLGMGIILIFIIVLLPYLKKTFQDIKEKRNLLKVGIFSKDAWLLSHDDTFVIPLLLVTVCMPYFHGSALITSLLLLFGMAIFSKKKLAYLMIAMVAISSSIIQTHFFSGGSDNVVNFFYNPGFVLTDHSIIAIIKYLFIISGLTIILSLGYSIKKIKEDKCILYLVLCFLIPIIFAFSFQLTIEMLANHKFIHFAIILFDILVAAYIGEILHKKKIQNYLITIILLIMLTGTGITEWATFINLNKGKSTIAYNSDLVKWIKENTDINDVFLTPMWSLNSFFLSGRQAFFGWPYYAWSAGHDTNGRSNDYDRLLAGMDNDLEAFINYCNVNHIRYYIESPDYYDYVNSEGIVYNMDYIVDNIELCASFDKIKIYKIY